MQISATASIQPIPPAERTATSAPPPATAKYVDQAVTAPKVFTPSPPLRPNVQDYVDIDRTLLMLREG